MNCNAVVACVAVAAMTLTGGPVAGEAGKTGDEAKKGKVMLSDDFKDGENWVVEKWSDEEAQVEFKDGKMHVRTHKGTDGVMIWCRKELPKDFLFEYDITPASKSGFFLVFFCAKCKDGKDILSDASLKDRSDPTLFKKYTKGRIDCYHMSYRRNESATCNFRKNSGMALLMQKKLSAVLPKGKTVHVALKKKGGHIVLTVDGQVFMDYMDEGKINGPVREGGKIGLRQVYESEGIYDNVRLTEL
jgi:hypothetical protein